jgi:hypothetical protein
VLLEHGASLEVGCEGSPPLHVAICVAAHGGIKKSFALLATSLLLQFGADPYDRCGCSAAVLGMPCWLRRARFGCRLPGSLYRVVLAAPCHLACFRQYLSRLVNIWASCPVHLKQRQQAHPLS